MREMLSLSNGGEFFGDAHAVLRDEVDAAEFASARPIVPLAQWKARAAEGFVLPAVWLAPEDDPRDVASAIDSLQLIALDFPKATDGRAYSIAALLRGRYGYRGELRAIGDVQIDQLFFMRRTGFDSAELPARWTNAATLPAIRAALTAFSDAYQGAADQPLPLFKRRLLEGIST